MDQPSPPLKTTSRAEDIPGQWLLAVKQRADKAAFVELFNYFGPRVKAYLRRQGLAADMAEDLTQDIMLQIWNRAGLYDPAKARASTWIFTIARNRLIDLWRQRKSNRLEVADLDLAASQGYEPQQDIDQARDDATLRAAIATLPEAQRELVEESFFEERSHHMIAKARKIPLGTVKSRLRLALDRLRKKIKRETP